MNMELLLFSVLSSPLRFPILYLALSAFIGPVMPSGRPAFYYLLIFRSSIQTLSPMRGAYVLPII
jgi:hypothetical protein